MQATLTQIQRHAKQVFRPVQNGTPVNITEHGKIVARIMSDCERQEVSLAEFFAAEVTDAAILQALQEARE